MRFHDLPGDGQPKTERLLTGHTGRLASVNRSKIFSAIFRNANTPVGYGNAHLVRFAVQADLNRGTGGTEFDGVSD
jgi:hypothetical protein